MYVQRNTNPNRISDNSMCYTLFVEGKLMHDAGMFDTMNSVEAVFDGVYVTDVRDTNG